jgi:phenylacetate-coenzyme A ligase PaaK-like adenylate-forming protein
LILAGPFPELGTEFEIVVTRPKALDELTVRAELAGPCDKATLHERVGAQLRRRLGIRADVAFVESGALARTDLKSRRVKDERPKA